MIRFRRNPIYGGGWEISLGVHRWTVSLLFTSNWR